MDTVFRIYDATKSVTEKYLITHWGTIKEDEIAVWIEDLTMKGVKNNSADANDRATVCEFDIDNLSWSGDMLKNSICKFWSEIQSLLKGKTGPEIFYAVVKRLKHTTASTSRTLTEKLLSYKLTSEPGMDVMAFSKKVTDIIEQILDCG